MAHKRNELDDRKQRVDNHLKQLNKTTRQVGEPVGGAAPAKKTPRKVTPVRVPGQAFDPVTAMPMKKGRPVPNYGSVVAGGGQDSTVPVARRRENAAMLKSTEKPIGQFVGDAARFYQEQLKKRRRK